MFNVETENKIVDFIKKSPLGVTSSEIANQVGLNRMTITKYLAIIREKALIDFKQFGMAKLWYIPVNINKETFLSESMSSFLQFVPKESIKEAVDNAGIKLGEQINEMYKHFYDTEKLSLGQLCEAFSDMGKKLGGVFRVSLQDKISVEIGQPPFASNKEIMSTVLSAVFAKITALNLGYGRAILHEHDSKVIIDVYYKKAPS